MAVCSVEWLTSWYWLCWKRAGIAYSKASSGKSDQWVLVRNKSQKQATGLLSQRGICQREPVFMFPARRSLACSSAAAAWYNFWSCSPLKDDFLMGSQKESLTAKRGGQVSFLLLSFSSSKFPWPPDPLQSDRVHPALPFHACCMFSVWGEKFELESYVSSLKIFFFPFCLWKTHTQNSPSLREHASTRTRRLVLCVQMHPKTYYIHVCLLACIWIIIHFI